MRSLIGTAIILMSCSAMAGSLTPPGAPGPTMKTLMEVEPRTPIHATDLPLVITQPGSYYLAENIKVTPADAVTTAAIVVESGYVTIDLNGFALSGSNVGGISGIAAQGHIENVTVRNGYVMMWEEYGITMDVDAATIENVTAAQNNGLAIRLSAGRVINCIVRNNLAGISFQTSLTNGVAAGHCVVDRCQVFNNGESGIMSQRTVAISNTNSSRNQGNGISLYAPGSTVQDCVANDNNKAGISLTSVATNCTITGNTCNNNDETGILVASRGSRIEGNHIASNQGTGIIVNQRSMVFKNTAYDNATANYSLISEAIAGPIITTTTGGTVDSDHPWANFSFHSTKIGN